MIPCARSAHRQGRAATCGSCGSPPSLLQPSSPPPPLLPPSLLAVSLTQYRSLGRWCCTNNRLPRQRRLETENKRGRREAAWEGEAVKEHELEGKMRRRDHGDARVRGEELREEVEREFVDHGPVGHDNSISKPARVLASALTRARGPHSCATPLPSCPSAQAQHPTPITP